VAGKEKEDIQKRITNLSNFATKLVPFCAFEKRGFTTKPIKHKILTKESINDFPKH